MREDGGATSGPAGPAVWLDRGAGGVPGGVWRLEPGDPTDRQVLRAVGEGADRPRFAADLAERLGLPSERAPVRLGSLVSLGYVAVLVAANGADDGYTLTEVGAAQL